MTETGPIESAKWIRAALQVNPYSYHGRNSPSTKFSDEQSYNAALIQTLQDLSISMIAITDHWCVDSALGLARDAEAAGIAVLPGFEANSSEGIHLLVLFERNTPPSTINAAIGQCGVAPSCPNGTTGRPYAEIMQSMTEAGALVIPAHANVANSGMLTGRSGNPLVKMIQHPCLHAIGITPDVADGIDQEAIFAGTTPYARPHELAKIHADDICHPDTLATTGASSWFKLSACELASLKLAVRTPGTRISLVDPSTAPRTVLGKISWEGGFLDGVSLDLSDELTTLIGGRGTGKSTVIESIRFVLDLDPLGPEAKKDHQSMVRNVLGPGATVAVTVNGVGPSLETYEVTRTVDQAPIVRDSAGAVSQLSAKDVIGAIEVFGQHELAELAHDKDNVAAMVQRFAGPDTQNEDESDVQLRLEQNRTQLATAEADLARLDGELADLPRLEEQMRIFTESALGEKLTDQQLLQKDEAIIAATTLRIDNLAASLQTITNEDIPGDLRAELEGLKESPRAETLAELSTALEAAAKTVEASLASIGQAVEAARLEASRIQATWTTETDGVRESTAETLRKLKDDGNDPGEFVATSRALHTLRQKAPARTTHQGKIRTLKQERTEILGELQIAQRAKAQRLRQAIREANAATDGTVNVRPVESPHRDHIKQLISSHVSGGRTTIMSAIDSDGFAPSALADSARLGRESLEEKFGIRGAQATNLIAAGESLFRQLEETTVGLAADVFLDVSNEGDPREYRKLEDLSKGQRATALLLLLLGASSAPLVIDQPEDDLDNRFVFSGVVKRLRGLKGQRQIILSTHNANIPVLGDAELVIALEGSGRKGQPVTNGIGSLDNPTIRQLAEDLLEGGSAAFGARHHLYGF
ncbi:hypothetical protein A5N17_12410 [Arthrobacter sp. D2]|uniref:TrlF family AAA-like ATPase n=1 Tax=Paenarthrobacter sp. R1 TaxID=3049085 RepID=UPI00084E5105|nr:hypothetical protein A5N13_22095 [Arthrobacter sp. D4]OEH62110.1 hypothetical protein A5N17_12410 [Arthrobacter sp. D2]